MPSWLILARRSTGAARPAHLGLHQAHLASARRRTAHGRYHRHSRRGQLRRSRRAPAAARPLPEGSAADFFVDYLTSALEPAEILTAITVPKLGDGWGYRYEKFHRTAQAWATVGVAALARRSNGHVAEARIGLTNMGPVPVRATAAEAAVAGAPASRDALRSAAAHADEGTQPPSDLHGAPDYRRHLARVLTGRALAAAAGV
jgi:aerobic carbon-monoxide dehydrogenase medium subunit